MCEVLLIQSFCNALLQDIPKQGNGDDCGVFTSCYAKALVMRHDYWSFSAVDMPIIRQKMQSEIKVGEIGHGNQISSGGTAVSTAI